MDDYIFETKEPLATNEITMEVFLNDYFYEVFDSESQVIKDDGTFVEVKSGDGILWGLHASGNGDFVSHRIRFEQLIEEATKID